jgi:2-dehydropantoate 2-reductase
MMNRMGSGTKQSGRLKIAVVGMGNIGSAYAFQLVRTGGHEVTAVARPGSSRLEQLGRDGAIVNTAGEKAEVQVSDKLDKGVPYDLVLVTLLAHQVDAVLPALQRCSARRIQFMFNNFEPERLQQAIGTERCSFGMPFLQARIDSEGRLDAKIGAAGQKSKMDSHDMVEVFNAAGLPAALEENMLLWLRCHVPMAVALESVSVAAVRRGGGASWKQAMVIARGTQEAFTLIQRLGYRLYPSGKVALHAGPAWLLASLLWSVSRIRSFRELLATGANECCALVASLVANASRAEQPVSVERIAAMMPSQW